MKGSIQLFFVDKVYLTQNGVSRSIHLMSNFIILFVLTAIRYFSVLIYHISIIHSSVSRHLSCFHFLGIENKTAINVDKQGSLY